MEIQQEIERAHAEIAEMCKRVSFIEEDIRLIRLMLIQNEKRQPRKDLHQLCAKLSDWLEHGKVYATTKEVLAHLDLEQRTQALRVMRRLSDVQQKRFMFIQNNGTYLIGLRGYKGYKVDFVTPSTNQ